MKQLIDQAVAEVSKVLLGKEQQVRLALACLFSKGHLLIEDLPGMGKTVLAHSLAQILGLSYNRIQFTSDLLPADILGASIFDKNSQAFSFYAGPIFSQLILADEINRSTPKAQSALLEAMEEHQVTVEGETRSLPDPFFVIATQNPSTQAGTFPLPESQLDRFLMCISLGYPDKDAEKELLLGKDRRELIPLLKQIISEDDLKNVQVLQEKVKATDSLIDYVQRLVQFTREDTAYMCGLSPRASIALLRCAKMWALMEGRSYVVPEDVQMVIPAVIGHRVSEANISGHQIGNLVEHLLTSVDVIE